MSATSGRLYGGLTAQERQDQRRVKLLDAGLQVFAAHGWTGAAVTDVCRVAQLSQRYFYEQFADREELFLAVSDRIAGEVAAVVRVAVDEAAAAPLDRAHDVLAALAAYFSADPRTVRVALVESSATPRLREHRARLLASFATLGARLMRSLSPDPTHADARSLELSALVLAGGMAEALVAAVTVPEAPPLPELTEHLARLWRCAAREASPEEHG